MGDIVTLHTVRIGEDLGREALLVDGVVQSISPDDGLASGGYWAAMVPDERPTRALILGLGGGTLARLLQARFGADFSIVGVDDDAAVVELARRSGWFPSRGLETVITDAFEFVKTCTERFDYVAIDLFKGEDFVGRALGRPFLRQVRALLVPRGRLVVNMFSDRMRVARAERIAVVYEVLEQRRVGGNVVIHARRRR